jgi:hypothetical protein
MPVIAAPGNVESSTSYAAVRTASQQELRSSTPIDINQPQLFTLTQRHFVVGGQQLILDEYPQIAIYPGRFEFEIVGWNLRLPYGKQDEIGREMMRKFLSLHGKADRLALNEHEEAEWADLVKRVDYRRFSIDRSPPRYVEGVLVERDDTMCKIRWHDGTTERVTGITVAALQLLEPGERFRGLARFGENNVLRDIANLALTPTDGEDGERMWREWPANR